MLILKFFLSSKNVVLVLHTTLATRVAQYSNKLLLFYIAGLDLVRLGCANHPTLAQPALTQLAVS